MGAIAIFNAPAAGYGPTKTARVVKEQAVLMQRLVYEQQVTKRLLWTLLTPEQRAAVEWPPPVE